MPDLGPNANFPLLILYPIKQSLRLRVLLIHYQCISAMADDHIDQPPLPEPPKKKRKKRKPLNCAGTSLGSRPWVSHADF